MLALAQWKRANGGKVCYLIKWAVSWGSQGCPKRSRVSFLALGIYQWLFLGGNWYCGSTVSFPALYFLIIVSMTLVQWACLFWQLFLQWYIICVIRLRLAFHSLIIVILAKLRSFNDCARCVISFLFCRDWYFLKFIPWLCQKESRR